jgi:hypothetical protein
MSREEADWLREPAIQLDSANQHSCLQDYLCDKESRLLERPGREQVRNRYATLIGSDAGGILETSGNREMIERMGDRA